MNDPLDGARDRERVPEVQGRGEVQEYITGSPDANYATLTAPNSGDTAYISGSFGAKYNGTVAVCGHVSGSGSESLQVQVSNDGSIWSTVSTRALSSSSYTSDTCIQMGSVTSYQYVKAILTYSSGSGLTLYIDSIGIFLGSYAQSEPSSGSVNTGSVKNGGNVLGTNDTTVTDLKAPNSGDSAWVVLNFGTHMGGNLELDSNQSSGVTSFVTVAISEDGTNFSNLLQFQYPSTSSSPTWVAIGTTVINAINNAQYVKITVTYQGGQSDLFLDAVYLE